MSTKNIQESELREEHVVGEFGEQVGHSLSKPYNNLQVWSAADLDKQSEDNPPLKQLTEWIRQYITKPHSQLGRSGAVCPFVPAALNFQSLWVSIVDWSPQDEAEACDLLKMYLSIYQSLEPEVEEGKDLRTLIVAFPMLKQRNIPAFIDAVHAATKPSVVDLGLMLGEFYPESLSPGIHNSQFYPLRSPMPLFVYRQMVPADLMFLDKPSDAPEQRIRFIQSYLDAFGKKLSPEWINQAYRAIAASKEEV
jgi:uncharacterized protein DUF6875